ncbi:DUF3298 and DUF4163 domain-containing protein [Agrilutibacter solisilvae]|uniref:DUF3298 domain-containing protein n=1 Tax=Agrilutibacter solisilvae TaxID=2763317 RepID=A0A975ARQ3_9GAMM|nr:DUF3298 and DUF4163 domain-containing protein [Lysobacter solisilvae]QSX78139.1 DUF3298 domain-containing protein [Lysobacter solisilvae]
MRRIPRTRTASHPHSNPLPAAAARRIPAAVLAVLVLACTLPACRKEQPQAPGAPAPATSGAPAAPAAAPAMELKDVTEHTPDYIIGISYPAVATRYPGLAAELRRYSDAARAELMQAVQGREKGGSEAAYELVLPFSELHVSPQLVVVAVDGSSYTGGAHGAPLIGRWVWLPAQNRLLTAQDLVPDAKGWEAIAGLVREQLHTALSQRVDADELPAGERVEVLKSASKMIEDGTQPDPAHYSQFEPVVGSDGHIRAMRFVFPPYQVGPYSDGTQTVEVPAAALLPYVAPQYRGLFQST